MRADTDTNESTLRTHLSDGPLRPAQRSACLVIIQGEGLGRRVDIEAEPILIGRLLEADLSIQHKSVSRRHCQVRYSDGRYYAEDLGATNTTKINNQPLDAERELADGDLLTVGEVILKFIARNSVESRYHEEIYQLAVHDALTDLYNRRHFSDVAEKEITRALRHQRPLSLCIIDVDLFKPINDRYGHINGDVVLRKIGAQVRQHARGDDVAARIGGEEFALLLPECSLAMAKATAERLREAVAALRFTLDGDQHRITISVGVATLGMQGGSRSTLMREADAALYCAKSEGRNRVCVAS